MPDQPPALSTVAHTVQIVIAPVFLLAGIGALLNVMTQRLARVIDRSRVIEAEIATFYGEERERALDELHVLDRRMANANRAIFCCTASALFVCLMVASLFVATLLSVSIAREVALLFVLAMGLLIAGLLFFLAEVRHATRSLRIRRDLLPLRKPRR